MAPTRSLHFHFGSSTSAETMNTRRYDLRKTLRPSLVNQQIFDIPSGRLARRRAPKPTIKVINRPHPEAREARATKITIKIVNRAPTEHPQAEEFERGLVRRATEDAASDRNKRNAVRKWVQEVSKEARGLAPSPQKFRKFLVVGSRPGSSPTPLVTPLTCEQHYPKQTRIKLVGFYGEMQALQRQRQLHERRTATLQDYADGKEQNGVEN